ncbi:MAG: CoA-substrate-specific enzyme activase [Pelosinus sp.]|jgi:hypothetical protein|nr:CoA-substrate-specific enzyme activase [Pelosinus sp.]
MVRLGIDIGYSILRDRDKDETKHPVLDLAFDGSSHSNNKELLDTFMHYI